MLSVSQNNLAITWKKLGLSAYVTRKGTEKHAPHFETKSLEETSLVKLRKLYHNSRSKKKKFCWSRTLMYLISSSLNKL
jgi:hypothetical protein